MSNTNNINVSASKPTEFEFDLQIQGISSESDTTKVRFVIEDVELGGNLALSCTKCEDKDNKWSVKLPALGDQFKKSSYTFHVEVVVDGYYFEPASGSLTVVSTPTVELKAEEKKPSIVATSFKEVGSSSEDKKEKDEKEEKVEEGAATSAGDMQNQTSPSNRLLIPEFPPETHHVEPDEEERKKKEAVSKRFNFTPGKGGTQQPQNDGKGEDFDPKEVAAKIVRNTMKVKERPERKGFLFSRIGEHAVIEGLEHPDTKKELDGKAQRVKDILNG